MKEYIKEINDGYIEPIIDPEKDYILGSGQVPQEVLQEDGQWVDYLVEEEVQVKGFDTFNCTGFNTTTPLEIQLRKRGESKNFSDRGLGIFAGTFPPGNDPHTVAEAVRKKGLFTEFLLPFSQDLRDVKEYYSFKGGDKKLCKRRAKQFLKDYFFKHDYLRAEKGFITIEELKEGLTLAPLAIAVFAWAKREDKYFRPEGKRDTHWTVLVGYKEGEYLLIFDSYVPFLKKLEWDYPISVSKRYFIKRKTEEEKLLEWQQLSLISKVIQAFITWITRIAEAVKILKKEEELEPKPEPKKSLLLDWGKAIEKYENTAKWRNNPGAIKNTNGEFLVFKNYEDGWDYLLDYLKRAATGKHGAYPKAGETTLREFFEIYAPYSDGNNSMAYFEFVVNNLKVATSIKIKELI